MTERRFLVSPGKLTDREKGSIEISGAEHHHLSRVLRLRSGDSVSVFDGAGAGFFGTIESVGRSATSVRLDRPDRRQVEPRFSVTLAQAIPQHERMEVVIQKTTELGVGRIVPLLTGRVPKPLSRSGGRGRLERWRRVACEAARQSGRLMVPVLSEPIAWSDFVSLPARSPRFLLDTGAAVERDLKQALHGFDEALIVVGPEGGWEEDERNQAKAAGFLPLGLGPRVLRTETAGIVAVALILYATGDMGPSAL